MTQLQRFVEFVEKTAQTDTLVRTLYAHFSAALDAYSRALPLPTKLTPELLRTWVIRMIAAGLSRTTYSRYFRRLHTLHQQFRRGTTRDPFTLLQPLLDTDYPAAAKEITSLLPRLKSLIGEYGSSPAEISPALSVSCVGGLPPIYPLIILLYLPTLSIETLLALKHHDPLPDIPQLHDLTTHLLLQHPHHQYLLPLGQGKHRPAALARQLKEDLNLPPFPPSKTPISPVLQSSTPRELLTAAWIAAALHLHIDPAEIRALIPDLPAPYGYLADLPPAPLTERRALQILRAVADSFDPRARRWHILHLRPGTKPEDLREYALLRAPRLSHDIEYYYPTHTVRILDAKKKRRVKKELPLLRSLLFIKIETQKVGKLISRIGDKAWCYRRTPSPTSPYTTIPNAEMQRFQRLVSLLPQFENSRKGAEGTQRINNLPSSPSPASPTSQITPFSPILQSNSTPAKDSIIPLCVPSAPLREETFTEGQIVKIDGDPLLDGMIGEIRSIKNADGTRTYTLLLSTTEAATWTVADLPEAYLLPV